jgi:hypothetical protein
METKKSVVTEIIEKSGSYNGSNGMIYYHTITFANGDKGQYGSKTETCEKFKKGLEFEYTIETKVNGTYTNYVIKPVQSQGGGGGFKGQPKDDSLIAAQSCLGYACTLNTQSSKATDTDYILSVAEKFHNWVMTKKSK